MLGRAFSVQRMMRIYRLQFKGSGFLQTFPPDGSDIIVGFSCTVHLKSTSESAALELGLAGLHADREVIEMIQESQDAEVETWKIECESITKLGLWRHLLPLPGRVFISRWMDKQPR